MTGLSEAKAVVEEIRHEIEASKNTHIWFDYVNALKLIAQTIFTRSTSFILELIQNAEDSGLGLETPGSFEIEISPSRLKAIHNGHPFSRENVEALCGIRSSKKPERGTLGYLGIGFKSVFKVTDRPEVYSKGFQFKFDRNYRGWEDPDSVPWHVLPIWLDQPSEPVDSNKTTFILPFRDPAYYQPLLQEVEKLRTELYMFLKWMKRIEVKDEISNRSWSLENLGETPEGVTVLRHADDQQRFRIFRRICTVPPEVRQDSLSQAYRANVVQREIAIAFALDVDGNLAPLEAGAMYGGVYSFIPLGEAKSGAKFPIQADFLVQPGRDAINYEAKWNHWLLEEVAQLCKEAIELFKKDERWKYQFLPVFDFSKSPGLESYERLFLPRLIDPIEKFFQEKNVLPLADEGFGTLDQVVRLTEDPVASEDLVTMAILGRNEVAPVLGGKDGLRLVHPSVLESNPPKIAQVDRHNLLNNSAFLEGKRQQPEASVWFRSLYLWLARHAIMTGSGRKRYVKGYHDHEFILSAEGKLCRGGDVWLSDLPITDPVLKDISESLQKSKPLLHPEILTGAKDDTEREELIGFLRGLTGVQILDSKKVCQEALLPKILTTSPRPAPDELLKFTAYCQQVLGSDIGYDMELWVLTKSGEVRAAKETLLPKEFKPEHDWETNQRYVPGLNFVSTAYIEGADDDDKLKAWREFFRKGGVKDSPDNGIEDFAVSFAMEQLRPMSRKLGQVDKRNFGYDIDAESLGGEAMRVEIKGLSHESDIDLTSNETETADHYKGSFYLCVVCPVPENPGIYLVRNPAGVGKKEKVTITPEIWKASRLVTSPIHVSSPG